MEISVTVIPNSKVSLLTKVAKDAYKVKVAAPASDGRANAKLITLLAEHFNVKSSKVTILKGAKSRKKIIRLEL